MKKTTAVIMGGGQGKRLFPLTQERAKPAVSFVGKYRLIDIPISNCINSGIKRIFVLTQFLSASLHRHIMQTYQFDTFTDGFVDLLAAEQTPRGERWFQGTADAVRATLKHTTYYEFSQMLILSGDHLYRMDYNDIIDFHQENNADITIGVYPVEFSEAHQFGLLKSDASGRINEFVEKPKDAKVIKHFSAPNKLFENLGFSFDTDRYLASMGIYVFKPDVIFKVLENQQHTDFGHDIIPAAIDNFNVMAFPFSGYWKDIGTIASFFDVNISLVKSRHPFHLNVPDWPFYTRQRSLPPSRVIRSEIRDSLLVEGSEIIGAKIIESIIGMRSKVRENTLLSEVVMLGADFVQGETILKSREQFETKKIELGIGKDCEIHRAIIDKNVRIGDNVVIRTNPNAIDADGENYFVRDGITIIPKGAVIPSDTKIIN